MKLTFQCQEKEERRYLEDFLRFYEVLNKVKIDGIISCPDQTNRTVRPTDDFEYLSDGRNKILESNIDEFWIQFRAISDICLGH